MSRIRINKIKCIKTEETCSHSKQVENADNSYFVCIIWEIKFTTFQRVQADEASQPQEHHRPAQLFHPTEVPGGIPRSLHCDGTYGCKPVPGLKNVSTIVHH